MANAIERLLTLRVSDVMTKQVISVSKQDTMDRARGRLLEHSISGAPVVDEQQFCVGVLSAMDFVKKRDGIAVRNGQQRRIDAGSNELVADHMSPTVHSIGADKPLLAAARKMCAQHIHRLPVLDCGGRPIGMITALDVVAAVVTAVEEKLGVSSLAS
jgi:CBS-domain-containing membrane protein